MVLAPQLSQTMTFKYYYSEKVDIICITYNKYVSETMTHRNPNRFFFTTEFATIRLILSVGWKASQNTYLLASLHVNRFLWLHIYPISKSPVAQQPTPAFSNPAHRYSSMANVSRSNSFSIVNEQHQDQDYIIIIVFGVQVFLSYNCHIYIFGHCSHQ